MCPFIEIPNELFARLQTHAIPFVDATPAAVIERVLNEYEKNTNSSSNDTTLKFATLASPAVSSDTSSVIESKLRVKPTPFLSKNFPELLKYKRSASRMYENKEKKTYLDNWWFNFMRDHLKSTDFIVFVGALDYANKNFRVFKVPTSYLLRNINKIDVGNDGWINLYVHMEDLIDVRNNNNLSFREFAIN